MATVQTQTDRSLINLIEFTCIHDCSGYSGGASQGTRGGLDQLSSPMRSRVEIVARKSDHICVVRDVPDSRNNWYQRQHSHHLSRQDSQGGGPLDHASSTQQAQAIQQQHHQPSTTAPSSSGQASGAGAAQQQPAPAAIVAPPAPAPVPAVTAKPSFASLLGRHPVIKEEPTTPGGSLLSETPPPSLLVAGKRSPLKLPPATGSGAGTGTAGGGSGATSTPAGPSSNAVAAMSDQRQMNQIICLLNDLRQDLRSDIAQLVKRVDSIETSVNRAALTGACKFATASPAVPEAGQQPVSSGQHQHGKRSSSSTVAARTLPPAVDAATTTTTTTTVASPKKTTSTSTSTVQSAGGGGGSLKPPVGTGELPAATTPSRERDRSKSPGRKHHHHSHHSHHSHHHHHRKASHSTPTATPSSSQLDLTSSVAPTRERPRETKGQQQHGPEPGAPGPGAGGQASARLDPAVGPRGTVGATTSATRLRAPPSFDQSDDDQDATSKL